MRSTSTTPGILLAIVLLWAAAGPLRAEVTHLVPPPATAQATASAALSPAELVEATGLEWMSQQEASFLATNSFSNGYLNARGYSKVHDNDALAARLHLPRSDPDLAASNPYGPYRLSASDEFDPALLALAALGLVTASISGILLYARNPLSRKRKYRRTPDERSQEYAA